VKEELKNVSKLSDADLPYNVRRERQITMLQELLKKYPGDFHVQRRYLDARLSGFSVDKDALVAEYRERMQKNAKDPIAIYLYGRLLVGRQTKEAIEVLQRLSQQAPDFPWTHLQLAQVYQSPNFRDAAKSNEHLKHLVAKCPATLDALGLILRSGDKEMMTSAAKNLRARLESSKNNDEPGYWGDLWALEFKLTAIPEHPLLRQRIAEDLKHIRSSNLQSKEWFQALQAGYKQVADKTNQRWAEDELVRLLPKSSVARNLVQSRFYDEHPFPKGDASEAERQTYQKALIQATTEWVKLWPDDELAWSMHVNALIPFEASNADVEAAYKGYAKAHEQGGFSYSTPPLEVQVARFYLKRGLHVERVPDLIQKSLREFEQINKNMRSDLYSRGGPDDSLKYVRLEAWPLLAEAYARLKQPAKAQQVLAQLADAIKPKDSKEPVGDAEKRSFAYNQLVYWQAVGKVAEFEQRKLDALTAYQTALLFRATPPSAEDKDELTDTARRLWKELKGTEQGWQAYLARTVVSKSKLNTAEISSWDSKNTELPAFELTDLQGRKWSLADLKGKVALINLWATWCGPCRMELPYVQKLREQMKDRKDVLVLTLNTDEEIGKVEPFMKENKYTFPVLLGQAYAEGQGVNSIPRNWVISVGGKVMFEGIGFGNDGEEWLKKATQLIEKVKGTN